MDVCFILYTFLNVWIDHNQYKNKTTANRWGSRHNEWESAFWDFQIPVPPWLLRLQAFETQIAPAFFIRSRIPFLSSTHVWMVGLIASDNTHLNSSFATGRMYLWKVTSLTVSFLSCWMVTIMCFALINTANIYWVTTVCHATMIGTGVITGGMHLLQKWFPTLTHRIAYKALKKISNNWDPSWEVLIRSRANTSGWSAYFYNIPFTNESDIQEWFSIFTPIVCFMGAVIVFFLFSAMSLEPGPLYLDNHLLNE